MSSSFIPSDQVSTRCSRRRWVAAGLGFAAVCAMSCAFAAGAENAEQVLPLSPAAQETIKSADIGFAVSQTDEATVRSQSGSSLLDSLGFMFKKEAKEEENDEPKAELKIVKRRPLAESIEARTAAAAESGNRDESLSSLSAEQLRQKGDEAFEAGDAESAEKYYLEQIRLCQAPEKIDESLISAYHHLGVIKRDAKEYTAAQQYFVLAIKSDPAKSPAITFDYAKLLYETEKYERAQKLFSYLEEKKPEITKARYYKGLCLLNLDPENDEILACLEEEVGREKACEMIAEKCDAVGAAAKAEEMRGVQTASRGISLNAGDLVGELAPASLLGGESNSVTLGGITNVSAEESSPSETSEEKTDSSENLQISGLTQDQTTRVNSPLINIETLGPKQTMVGKESEYKIAVENRSSQQAVNLVVRTAIPEDVDITSINASAGASHISGEESGQLVCLWNLGDFAPEQKEQLIFKFTPRVRNNINFVTDYEYDKAVLNSDIVVTQPVIEIAIEGNDVIQWGSEGKYFVKIRNSGDGTAQNVRLTVATGDNENATRILQSLEPGEEKQLELNLKTVLDGVLDVNVQAEADYGFTAAAQKSIDILRGELNLFVEVPDVQFVNENADYIVHVCNIGRAPLSDVDVTAAVPSSIEVLSTTGSPTQNKMTNQLLWSIPSIKPEEEIIYRVSAKMIRAGASRLDVTAADRTGVSCFGNAEIQVEAIAALEMKINKPSGAIATGKEVVYEVVISNSGTKAAENVDAGFFLPTGMVPTAVEGGGKVIAEEQKVLFNKVNYLGPGQSVSYKVHAIAEERGNHKVQAVLESKADNVQLVSEEMNFFYDRKPSLAQRSDTPADEQVAAKNSVQVSRPRGTVRLASRPADEAPFTNSAELGSDILDSEDAGLR